VFSVKMDSGTNLERDTNICIYLQFSVGVGVYNEGFVSSLSQRVYLFGKTLRECRREVVEMAMRPCNPAVGRG